jgi:hypothetical protein
MRFPVRLHRGQLIPDVAGVVSSGHRRYRPVANARRHCRPVTSLCDFRCQEGRRPVPAPLQRHAGSQFRPSVSRPGHVMPRSESEEAARTSLALASFVREDKPENGWIADGRDLSGATHRASERHPHAFPRLGPGHGAERVVEPMHPCRDRLQPPAASRQSMHRTTQPPRSPTLPRPVCQAASRHPEPWRAIGAKMCWAEDAGELSAPPRAVFPGSSRSLRDFRCITPHERWDREGTSQERSKAPCPRNFDQL